MILNNLNILYKRDSVRCLQLVKQFFISLQSVFVLLKHLPISYLAYLFRDPVIKLKEIDLFVDGALLKQLPIVQLHDLLEILVIHFV